MAYYFLCELSEFHGACQCVTSNIADFTCREKKWVIELDGSQDIAAAEYAQQRTEHLGALGYRVLRFWNNDVFNNIEVVLNTIVSSIESVPLENTLIRRCAPPSPRGEGITRDLNGTALRESPLCNASSGSSINQCEFGRNDMQFSID